LTSFDQAIEINERLVEEENKLYTFDLADSLFNKSVSLRQLGQLDEALLYHEKSITLLRGLLKAKEDADTAGLFASVLDETIEVLKELGYESKAADRSDEADEIRRRF